MNNVPLMIASNISVIGVQVLLVLWLRSAIRRATSRWGLFEIMLAGQAALVWGYELTEIRSG